MGLFGKKEQAEETKLSKDKIGYYKLEDDDEFARELVFKMRDGYPIVLQFSDLEFSVANKYLGFFVGATVALDGQFKKFGKNSYLFARREEFEDGSLNDLILEFQNRQQK